MSNQNPKRTYTRRTVEQQVAEAQARLQRLQEAAARGVQGAVNLNDPAHVALRALATAASRCIRYGRALGGEIGASIVATGEAARVHCNGTALAHGIGLPDPETRRGRPVSFLR
jgi:hypothetical protein